MQPRKTLKTLGSPIDQTDFKRITCQIMLSDLLFDDDDNKNNVTVTAH